MPDFGPVLRKLRQETGWSQQRLADESGVSLQAVNALETGRRRYPWRQTVDLLANALELHADQRAELSAAAARPKAITGAHGFPADVTDFVGRAEQIATVSDLLTGDRHAPGVVVISAIAGMGGVGKTALTVRVARELTDRFADGVLYLNLRGFGAGEPMTPAEALNALLQQLGFALHRAPGSTEEAAGLFRSACAARRLLVVLDNVATVEQVLPLLPGTSTCAVIVTSRRALVGLPGAGSLDLDVLPDGEALALLTTVAGARRVETDLQAAREVVARCGSLPLAIRIAGSRLAAEPSWTVADLARRLADDGARLDLLGDGVRASIALSLAGTSAADVAAAEIFGLLGLYEGNELDLKVAARLVDRPESEIEPLLEHLVDLHLLESTSPRRYQFHDLVRAYARELASTRTDATDRAAARKRVMELYITMAWGAWPDIGGNGQAWLGERRLAEADEIVPDEALAWLDGEAIEILAVAIRRSVDAATILLLAVGMSVFWADRRRNAEAVKMLELAVAVLESEPGPHHPFGIGQIRYRLAHHYAITSNVELAAAHMRAGVEVARGHDYHPLLEYCELDLARFLERLDQLDEALIHARAGLELALATGDGTVEGWARFTVAVMDGRLGRADEQDRGFARAVELVRSNDASSLSWLIRSIGDVYSRCGRNESARSWLCTELAEVRASGEKFALADHLQILGAVEVELAAYDDARETLENALALIVDSQGELEAAIRHALGSALVGLGETEPAREQWLLALELYQRYGLPQTAEVRELLNG
ncbi:ATP-binding protein [Kribbella sp. NPDC051587]|uniref:ATP-binding protein n=1 Tax=Kribbella sp. NPDC051587 TaxID=3364119 RepID=UPI0037B02D04